jgi:hypothetical protein
MENMIYIGAMVDNDIMDKVQQRLDEEYSGLMPQTTLYRILLGMFADGRVDIDIKDVKLYSGNMTYRNRANNKKQK